MDCTLKMDLFLHLPIAERIFIVHYITEFEISVHISFSSSRAKEEDRKYSSTFAVHANHWLNNEKIKEETAPALHVRHTCGSIM